MGNRTRTDPEQRFRRRAGVGVKTFRRKAADGSMEYTTVGVAALTGISPYLIARFRRHGTVTPTIEVTGRGGRPRAWYSQADIATMTRLAMNSEIQNSRSWGPRMKALERGLNRDQPTRERRTQACGLSDKPPLYLAARTP